MNALFIQMKNQPQHQIISIGAMFVWCSILNLVILSGFWAGDVAANESPQVTNVRAIQRSDTMLVDITYDLADADGDTLVVRVAILDSAGVDTIRQAVTFSGDVGAGIRPDAGKKIVWNVGKDQPNTFRKYVALVTASDAPLFSPGPGGGETITVSLPGGVQMDFVNIKPGTFTMGSPESVPGRLPREGPQHEVTILRDFYLGKYEVTQAQWEAVMQNNPSRYSGPNKPVESIPWNDIQVFIQKLNAAAGDSLYRLPTEAEWEYACRAGTTTRWFFGEDESLFTSYAWYGGNDNPEGTKAIGTKLPNPWGLYDMHGNVWEWCQDWYGENYYSTSPAIDPVGPASGTLRVQRGGNFDSSAGDTRSAFRSGSAPGNQLYWVGFRLLRRVK